MADEVTELPILQAGAGNAQSHQDYRVLDEELSDKCGNYLFTIGNVGCGKSTLQNFLVARLWNKEGVVFAFRNKKDDHRHDSLLHEMVMSVQDGRLPERTQQGKLQEFTITISQDRRKPLELNFLEISGEDIKSIVPTLEISRRPKINQQLVEYLRAPAGRINTRFVFVSDCEENQKNDTAQPRREFTEDILFDSFLRHILGREGIGMARIDVLFVAAKWDIVERDYKAVSLYFRRNFPNTMEVLKSNRCNATYIPFSVGSVDVVSVASRGGAAVHEKRITALETKYVDFLIQWIYHSFTGRTLRGLPRIKPTLLQRLGSLTLGRGS